MTKEELTANKLEALKVKISEAIISKGLNNSGDAIASLEVEDNKLFGNDYIFYLDKGRGPGKFPPVQNIRDWVRSKLGISDEKEINSVAFLVGRKISETGTEIFKDNSKGIELDKMIDETLEEIYKELPEVLFLEINTFLK